MRPTIARVAALLVATACLVPACSSPSLIGDASCADGPATREFDVDASVGCEALRDSPFARDGTTGSVTGGASVECAKVGCPSEYDDCTINEIFARFLIEPGGGAKEPGEIECPPASTARVTCSRSCEGRRTEGSRPKSAPPDRAAESVAALRRARAFGAGPSR